MAMILVKLNGGSGGVRYVKYSQPLPNTIVIARNVKDGLGLAYEDYQRRNNTTEYDRVSPQKKDAEK